VILPPPGSDAFSALAGASALLVVGVYLAAGPGAALWAGTVIAVVVFLIAADEWPRRAEEGDAR